ncbi:MAG TPA: PilZ domain-containing protein [Thermoanaerobaculia bacterium]|nr:PilZ domain-containing protein [Thermoanaerobaculia bacterium]
MSRRRSARRARRVSVTFWKQGDLHPYTGFTTNISLTGMFVGTNSPLPGGTRLRVEIHGERGFVIEGVVAHARKVRGEMARVTQSGMGVRFLTAEELVRELMPSVVPPGPPGTAATLSESVSTAEEAFGEEPIPPAPPAEIAPPPPVRPVPPPAAAFPAPVRPVPPPAAAFPSPVRPVPPPSSVSPPASPTPIPLLSSSSSAAPVADGGTFSVDFPSPRHFLDVFERDIKNGGLFVSTRYPGRLSEMVTIELHPPDSEPIRVRARVVQRFEPQGASLLSGMGVELFDAQSVCDRLRPIVARLSVR